MTSTVITRTLILVAMLMLAGCFDASAIIVGKACDDLRPCPGGFACLAPDPGAIGSCARASCESADDCVAGYVCAARHCLLVCGSSTDCSGDDACCTDGVCQACNGAPQITKVSGNGSTSCPGAVDSRCFTDGLTVEGSGLSNATLRLEGSQSFALVAVAGGTSSRVSVLLPASLPPGTYELVVANAAGADQTTVSILQGEPGPKGDPGEPGGGHTLKRLQASGVVNPGGMVGACAITVDDVVSTACDTDNLYIVLYDPMSDTTTVRSFAHGQDSGSFALALGAASTYSTVIVATRGDASDTAPSVVSALKQYGASQALEHLASDCAYAFVGGRTLGEGNGLEHAECAGGAFAQVSGLVVDGVLTPMGGHGITQQMKDGFVNRAGDTVYGNLDVRGTLTMSGYPVFRDWGVATASTSANNVVTATCPAGMKAIAGGCEVRGSLNGTVLASSHPTDNGDTFNAWTCFYTVSAAGTQYLAYATCARVQ